MNNSAVAGMFRDIAAMLQIQGENPFRIRAYERAAQNIESLPQDLEVYRNEGRLKEIPGVGEDLAQKIEEIITSGSLKFLKELEKSMPEGLLELLQIPSVGPKTARLLFESAGIKGVEDLRRAIAQGKLKNTPGIRQKTIENILHGIGLIEKSKERMSLAQATFLAGRFLARLAHVPGVKKISVAGSLRRRKETVRDIDILITSKDPAPVMATFLADPEVKETIARGQTKASVRTQEGVQIDCRVVEEKSFGAALLYFTGSKNFNIKLRQRAIKKGYKINEYGIFRKDKYAAGAAEEDIFKVLGLAFIDPELREDMGEIESAAQGSLPRLVAPGDIHADFHVHSRWSDGSNTIREMAEAARARGYTHIALTDHSQGLKVAGGLSLRELKEKKKEIDALNRRFRDFTILFGGEVDIDSQGNLDYPDEVLKNFDIVVAAIHSGFKQSKTQLTKRVLKAVKNRYVHIIAHPTGKLWGEREGYEIDFEEIFKAASDTRTFLEINSFPQRLDLDSTHCRLAKDMGVKIAISTDAHSVDQLDNMQFGVSVARRGWLTREDVINTLSLEQLRKTIKR